VSGGPGRDSVYLARSERRDRRVPGQPKQRHPVESIRTRCLIAALDFLGQRPLEIRLGGHGYEAARTDLLDDLHHSRIEAWEEIAGRIERVPSRAHHAPLVEFGVDFSRLHECLHGLVIHPELGEFLLDVLADFGADRVGQQAREPQHELALRDVLHHHLVSHVRNGAGPGISLVATLDVARSWRD
jgi:hypothetical protein